MPVKSKSNELKLRRVFDAPLKAVWEAWADSEQAAQWWGPRGFTITTHSKDLRPGGHWRYTMHGPDGVEYANLTTYLEVEEYSKLVYDHGATENSKPLFRVTVLFTECDGKTEMDMTMTLPTPEAAEQTRKFIKQAGGDSTWDRLAEYVVKELSGKPVFVINRTFKAPKEVLFDMWTKPEHLARWLPPTGFDMEFIRADIRTGGSSFYVMSAGASMKMYGRAIYSEITRPDRLVYAQQFCDENENISRHPMAPVWPETMHTTVVFTEEEPELTRVTVTWECGEGATPEEIEAFVKERGGMTRGWTGSFDKLEAVL
ncbi:MAG: SRPBCC family protein [Candidatus Obscuribacterales bacterium]